MEIRLNKFISDSGFCSRREADRFIQAGKVTINRSVASLGDMVKKGDVVKVNGTPIENDNEPVYIALNKPVGISSSSDTPDKSNVINYMKFPTRIFHIGRLDKDSEGLLLLTNDGDIVNKILRAGNRHEKEYEVWVDKPIDSRFVEKMSSGVKILGTVTKPCKVELEGATKFRITLTQGLNRQIRRMCSEVGVEVVRLKRVRIMNIRLDSLQTGEWRILEGDELTELFASLKDSDGSERASKGSGAGKRERRSGSRNFRGGESDRFASKGKRFGSPDEDRDSKASTPSRRATGKPKSSPDQKRGASASAPKRGSATRPGPLSGKKPQFGAKKSGKPTSSPSQRKGTPTSKPQKPRGKR